jgi:hypothetical protein
MPGEFSTAGAGLALDAVTGRVAAASRVTYLALLTAAPTDATTMATMTEVFTPGTSGYTRVAVTWGAPTGDPALTSNTNTVTVGAFTADPATITHCALVSAATGTAGVLYSHWALTTPRDPAIGDTITFAPGDLSLTLD